MDPELEFDDATRTEAKEFTNKFQTKIQALFEQAPSDSSVRSKISKLKKGYIGVLEIFSSEGHFEAKAFDLDPMDVGFALLKEIYKQLGVWRKQRHIVPA